MGRQDIPLALIDFFSCLVSMTRRSRSTNDPVSATFVTVVPSQCPFYVQHQLSESLGKCSYRLHIIVAELRFCLFLAVAKHINAHDKRD